MSTPNDEVGRLSAECRRLRTVDELLVDITESAWTSIERKEFADSGAEFAKLDQTRPALQSVRDEARETRSRYLEAAYGKEGADEIRARTAARMRQERRALGIERSR